MSETNAVSFKVFLKDSTKDQNVEVRRFNVDREVSTSLANLQEKLATLFPRLRRDQYTLSWTDSDGDSIVLASDEELSIALSEMSGPIYQLRVNIKDNKKEDNHNNDQGEKNIGVSCDGCEKEIRGFRYKCAVCPDYDLCGSCESKETHPDHNMMRIASPYNAWPGHFFMRLNKMHDSMMAKSKRFGKENQVSQEEEMDNLFNGCGVGGMRPPLALRVFNPCGPSTGPRTRPMGRVGHPLEPHGRPHGRPLGHPGGNLFEPPGVRGGFRCGMEGGRPVWLAQLQKQPEAANEKQAEANKTKVYEDKKGATNTNNNEPSFREILIQDLLSQLVGGGEAGASEADYRKSFGDLVVSVVDPLDIETKNKKPKEKEGELQKKEEEAPNGWTLVKESAKSGDEKKEGPSKNVVYPEEEQASVPPAAAAAAAEASPKIVSHPDPRIQVALQAMINMGFSDDGGWLTNLLETKNGDISKTLSAFQPGKY